MAKKPKDELPTWDEHGGFVVPPPPTPDGEPAAPLARYPGQERFGDWSLDGIVPIDPGEELVNTDPEGDPYKFAYHGQPRPYHRKKKEDG